MTDYIFKDVDSYHRYDCVCLLITQLAAQCRLPIGHWQCIFKDANGVVYNANSNNTWSRINSELQ